jgi:hypothetical protein
MGVVYIMKIYKRAIRSFEVENVFFFRKYAYQGGTGG